MRIGVLGTGAIGGVVAARLLASRAQGEEIALGAGRSAPVLRARGLQVSLRGRLQLTVPAPEQTHDRLEGGPWDALLLCTRGEATEEALRPVLAGLRPAGFVVALQNGLPEPRVLGLVGPGRALGAVIGWSASASEPGRYNITGAGRFTLGSADAAGAAKLALAAALLDRAFPVRVTQNLEGARWSKLAFNCALSSLGALSGLTLGELAQRRVARTLALRLVAEVVRAAEGKGVALERVAGVSPRWLAGEGLGAQRLLRHGLIRLATLGRGRQRSGLVDRLRAGRPTGIEELNGAVVAAAAPGLCPLNEAVVARVRALEAGQGTMGPHQLEALLAVGPAPTSGQIHPPKGASHTALR